MYKYTHARPDQHQVDICLGNVPLMSCLAAATKPSLRRRAIIARIRRSVMEVFLLKIERFNMLILM
jgi:hypothetical protein